MILMLLGPACYIACTPPRMSFHLRSPGGSRRGRPGRFGECGSYLWSPPTPGGATSRRGGDCGACMLGGGAARCAGAAPHLGKNGNKIKVC